jgi:hypothetical protein
MIDKQKNEVTNRVLMYGVIQLLKHSGRLISEKMTQPNCYFSRQVLESDLQIADLLKNPIYETNRLPLKSRI